MYRRVPLVFHFAEFAQKKGCRDIASCKAYVKEFVSQWLEQHGAKAKTAVAVRKHAIDAECGVRQMLQLACKEPVSWKSLLSGGLNTSRNATNILFEASDCLLRESYTLRPMHLRIPCWCPEHLLPDVLPDNRHLR